ncbi:Rhodanese domain-containing protein [Plasmodiophora brassicae]|uniref:Rhodanese domain-containing protein n=1 Tax=Plasmodiophora brassicae TaxID=37360 RepID=A0A0G4ISD9_PLABS|nr:hypothetical protein PBRA_006170 [Plasmodiophora brassicae]SPQ96123.1 unnamed protein product [Plasmodiophora brassicae]
MQCAARLILQRLRGPHTVRYASRAAKIPNAAPEISPEDLKEARDDPGADLVVLDVREDEEIALAKLRGTDVQYVTLGDLFEATERPTVEDIDQSVTEVLPPVCTAKDKRIVVVCHHGVRSKAAADMLWQLGWRNVASLYGGLHLYAENVDPSIGKY